MTTRIVNKSSTLLSGTSKENSPKDLQNPENRCILDSDLEMENQMENLVPREDVSKFVLDNKLYNIQKLSNMSIFGTLCNYFNALTDGSFVYVPFNGGSTTITRKTLSDTNKNKKETIVFDTPNPSNNYADLAIRFSKDSTYFIKMSRVDTFHLIQFDGHLLTFDEGSISHKNYILFYSVNPKETDKLLIMSTYVYKRLTDLNYDNHFKMFDIKYLDKVKQKLGINDNMMMLLDIDKGCDLTDEELMNAEIKRGSIVSYMEMIAKLKENAREEGKSVIVYKRTHQGRQYSAYNMKTGQIIQFRDCHARNNFFERELNCKLADNKVINRNTNNMDDIINGKKVKSYKVNILDNGWIILNHYSNLNHLLYAVRTFIAEVTEKSKRLANRIARIMKDMKETCIEVIERTKEEMTKIKRNLMQTVRYFTSLRWFLYMTERDFPDVRKYRQEMIC